MTTTQQMLDDRYGRTHRTRRFWIWFAGVSIAVAVGIAAVFAITASRGTTDASTTAFQIVDAHSITVSFQVAAPSDSALACILEAQDSEHGIVGWKVVRYPASDAYTRAFTETVPTVGQAVTGLVNSCWVP